MDESDHTRMKNLIIRKEYIMSYTEYLTTDNEKIEVICKYRVVLEHYYIGSVVCRVRIMELPAGSHPGISLSWEEGEDLIVLVRNLEELPVPGIVSYRGTLPTI